ncbi:uncharacterized protein [Rutidosis leptorrhynchoides]|uniref:uncharacterized protein n=1 Tax=Rutidosis leptorrhynchoides TaxID=125765 RepID=UPI003A98E05E
MGSTAQQVTMRNGLEKVEVFIWRVQTKRLHVKLELDKRGLDLHSVRCPNCDDDLESLEYALVSFKHVKEIWIRVLKWWDLQITNTFSLVDLIGSSCSSPIRDLELWQALKWIVLYCIWKHRNKVVFQGKPWSAPMIFNEIQSISFLWIANRAKGKDFEWLIWISKPSSYLT